MRFSDQPESERLLEQLMNLYGTDVLRMCYLYMKDGALAEDAAQETFLKAYRKLDTLRDESKAKAWLMRIAGNVCKDQLRTAWFRRVDRRITPETLPDSRVDVPLPEDSLSQAVMGLPVKAKEAVILHYYQGFSVAETAVLLRLPENTVKSRLMRARKTLRSVLERWDLDE
ncbi:MAG TPA: sigma-70 family RNA polymerase sigma factor [Candidatus Limiplasma sp.]|nr:sigma-70 family RNA polymerase sigma factor [Candidatus Limiplasma sp.]